MPREPQQYPGEGDTTLWQSALAWALILGVIFGVGALLNLIDALI